MSGGLVVVSPHFDDAALSVGALIARSAAAGDPVRVLTVYTEPPSLAELPGRSRFFGDYATRQAEDDRAMILLGAASRRLGLRERLFRHPPLKRSTDLFRTSGRLLESAELLTIERCIVELLEDPGIRILAPLGIGNHYDHVEVATAAMRVAAVHAPTNRIEFYEDFPALSELWRRRHPVARRLPQPLRSAPLWASPAAGIVMEAMSVLSRGPTSPDLAGQSPRDGAHWSARIAPVDGYEKVKLRAIAQYRTQLQASGADEHPMAKLIRRAHHCRGGEILWRLDLARTPPTMLP
ncbi:PIG-L deacetylase family protein [Nocardia africana]|uniref:Uncharacterized proteins, LmbE homologs n=1 Tax=Nocardia africana TaxID=134964 RepID=A0A378X1K6_9NOCA|nr:PIG-L family deacetylase [Nocardia africana]SUA47486.1 Uncharacterized proteins, LmbE homologs [Nocardia africana]